MDDRQLRLLFTAKEQRYSVSDLTRRIADLLAAEFTGIWVDGEVSGMKVSRQGHLYFSLRDREAILPCVCFRGAARLLRFRPEEGLAISARGRIDVYEARGQYQFIVEAIELRGQGALQAAFEKLKAQLAAEGLFSSERKRKLPAFPRRIGIITSPTGAAIRDILQILARRCPGLSIRIYPALVQGAEAPGEIAAGLKWFSENPWAEVVIVGRGGGSLEDLWAFNTEVVARAIAASNMPVVSAVGHETDVTIADFVADLRAPTPSAAAELVVPNRDDLLASLSSLSHRLRNSLDFALLRKRRQLELALTERAGVLLHRRLASAAQRLDDLDFQLRDSNRDRFSRAEKTMDALRARLSSLDLRTKLARYGARLDAKSRALTDITVRSPGTVRHRLDLLNSRLESLNPTSILARGYALVYAADGGLVRDARPLDKGDSVSIRFARGGVDAVVSRVIPGDH